MMDWLTNIPDWLSLIFGGSIISIVTWRFARQKAAAEAKEAEAKAKQAEAEAKKAEAEAMKEKQDYYQQMADDLAKDRDYYKGERDEYRKTSRQYDERMNLLERNQADAEAMLSECLYARTPLDLDQRYSAVRMMITPPAVRE